MDVGIKIKHLITHPEDDGQTCEHQERLAGTRALIGPTVDVRSRKDNVSDQKFQNPHPVVDTDERNYGTISPDGESAGFTTVDMGRGHARVQPKTEHAVIKVRQPNFSEAELNVNIRPGQRPGDFLNLQDIHWDEVDLKPQSEEDELSDKFKHCVIEGGISEVRQLLDGKSKFGGVICNNQKLRCQNDDYQEGQQYTLIGQASKGAYGEASLCQDAGTGCVFVLKKVKGKPERNEIEVPLSFVGQNDGVPEVFGIIMRNAETQIYQEFAGLSLKHLMSTDVYRIKLQDLQNIMILAVQGFATLDILHGKGVCHLDVKPENLCVDINGRMLKLKLIDFGSSQTLADRSFQGLTNEYLSPESCRLLLEIGLNGDTQKRLGPGTDVWAFSLSLLYCLWGFHVMIYLCTGQKQYLAHGKELLDLRMQSLLKIATLTDAELVRKLIDPRWPEPLQVLLCNTLKVKVSERWTAKMAVLFALNWLKGLQGTSASPTLAPSSSAVPTYQVSKNIPFSAPVTETVESDDIQVVELDSTLQTSSPDSPSAQLPAFTSLLSDGLRPLRPYKRRSQDGPTVASRRGAKCIKK